MVNVACPVEGCNYVTGEYAAAVVSSLLAAHTAGAHVAPVRPAARRPPKVDRPELTDGIDEEEWNAFEQSLAIFIRANGIEAQDLAVQMYSCCKQSLKQKITAVHPDFLERPTGDLLALLRTLTVVPVAKTVKQNEFLQMRQEPADSIRTFHSKVKSKAITCGFKKHCTHPHAPLQEGGVAPGHVQVDYTNEMIRHVIMNGLYDEEIRREIFGNTNIDNMEVTELITLIESKETARDATNSASTNALSNYKRHQQRKQPRQPQTPSKLPPTIDINKKEKCSCGATFNVYAKLRSGHYNKTPFTACMDCWKQIHQRRPASNSTATDLEHNAITFDISIVNALPPTTDVVQPVLPVADHVPTDDATPESNAIITVAHVPSTTTTSATSAADVPVSSGGAVPTEAATVTASPLYSEVVKLETPAVDSNISEPSRDDQHVDASINATNPFNSAPKDQPNTIAEETISTDAPEVQQPTLHAAAVAQSSLPPTVFNAGRLIMKHHVFQDGQWKSRLAQPHPTVDISLSTHTEDYNQFNIKNPPTVSCNTTAVVDSGAQCCVWGWALCRKAGFRRCDLIPVRQKLNGVSKSKLTIFGALLLRLHGTSSSGVQFSAAAIVYVSPDVSDFYMSQDVMIQLCIVPPNFPCIGGATSPVEVSSSSAVEDSCPCLPRRQSSGRPEELPMPVTEENIPAMKEYLLDRYKDNVFNQCIHQHIPKMNGPPMRIHVDPEAEGTIVTKQGKCPLHWEEKVQQKLDQDVLMGVIEPFPQGKPPKWVHRAHYVRKPDGDIRRVIDLSPLNKHCQREVHGMQSPFELAKGIPADTWRTVTDAWNGYHSIELHKDDRHLTAFMGPKGKLLQYCVAPQGYASSGDGYNRRCEELFSPFERLRRCVDDTLLYDPPTSLAEHWWRVIDFLECCANNGIILNPKKFQFCQKSVDFAGFHLTQSTVEPLPKYLDSIAHFPTPTSTTDIKAWFGLVNQVAHYAQLRDILQPFRQFLSPTVKFFWNDELQQAFDTSKEAIVAAIKEGVEIYDLKRKTCLRSDWSKQGIGFYLSQKHCSCDSDLPNCCENGWRITLCGSRFLKKAEERYAPIEGEALAVAWSLEQTKYFTMGCDDLIVVVDHKPLTKLLGDRALDEISNPRLFRIKQRTLPWIYEIAWLPGKNNHFSDATSRHPQDSSSEEASMIIGLINQHLEDTYASTINEEQYSVAAIRNNVNNVIATTWDKLQQSTFEELESLTNIIHEGFPLEKKPTSTDEVVSFWPYREGLHIYDGVVMYKDRVVVPPSLRKNVLTSIHAAHQGCSSMNLTAESTVFWPNISKDVEKTRQLCKWCNQNAPSQPKLTPITPIVPTTPFEAVVADYFKFRGWDYLVVADRLSAWTECYHSKSVESGNKSRGLINMLKRFFGTFGVPTELSSDGGPQFIADDTSDFFARWGVMHRLSSAYNPQSNGRAELAVKSTKRLLLGNIDDDGSLDTENFLQAILIKRNTPDPTTKLSPAEIVFGRKLRDTLPRVDKSLNVFFNPQFRSDWRNAWQQKELALRQRYGGCQARLAEHSKSLPQLVEGDRVLIQNQSGTKPTKWDRSGTIVEVRDFNKYVVKVDGSGRLTLRNRRFLKKLFLDEGMFHSKVPPPPITQNIVNNEQANQADHVERLPTRQRRVRTERLFYDANLGTYVPRNTGY